MSELPSHFGPYQIISPLGAGGMGQVYRARDTRLQRFVAIKILHDHAALDPDRQRRFAQEAVAASALNHPNILTVYDVGTQGDAQYLVSELIDGDSLRTEMNRERLPIKRIVDITYQVAEGLAAAHDAGIVHRDLKPENIMVTRDGRVKIVDFGLARAPEGELSILGTLTSTKTAAGLIMGTVPYMSPEQARGGDADFRSDQFALGVILYELTTTAHPFKRETAVQTLSAIIAEEPPDPAQAAPTLPVAVRWLIRRLLAKNPRERFANTADLAADLRTIRDYLSEATSASGATAVVAAPSRRTWMMLAAIAAFLIMTATAIAAALIQTDADLPAIRWTPFATEAGYQSAPGWSPDGKQIAYEAEVDGVVQVFTCQVGSPGRTQVTHSTFDCHVSAWSSDGYIYYHSAARDSDGLWKVSPVGGNPKIVLEKASQSAISPDGTTLYFLRDITGAGISYQLWFAAMVDPEGTQKAYLRAPLKDWRGSGGFMKFSPDGSKLLLWVGPGPTQSYLGAFFEISMPDGDPKEVFSGLIHGGGSPEFFSWADNRYVVMTRPGGLSPGAHLWLADTYTDRLTPLTTTPGNEGVPSVSPDGGSIAATSDATDFDVVEIPIDGSRLRPILNTNRDEFDPAVSPNGAQFAFVTNRTGYPQIWMQSRQDLQDPRPVVTEADFDGMNSLAIGSLAVSTDGTRLAFQMAGGPENSATETFPGGSRIWVKTINGGKPFPIGGQETFQDAPTWSPNDDWIAYLFTPKFGELALAKSQVGTRGSVVLLSKTDIPPFVARPQWSRDGNWILCETSEGLSMIAADGSLRSRVIAESPWFAYAWDASGRMVYGLRPDDDLKNIMLVSVDVETTKMRVINPNLGSIPPALQPVRGFSRFGKGSFLTSIAPARSDIYLIEGFQLPRWWQRLWRWRVPKFLRKT
jgi:eukaryotic-like serine/threonine-protein kinase